MRTAPVKSFVPASSCMPEPSFVSPPVLAPVMESLKQLGRYTEAELMAAVVSGFFTAFIKSEAPEMPLGQALPDDETFYHPSGIRMGVQEMTRYGMEEKDFETLASLIAGIVIDNKDLAGDVAKFRSGFSKMRFAFSFDETKGMLASILKSVFSDEGSFGSFVDALK